VETLGSRLKQARERRVMTQEDLSRAAGVTEATISRTENEKSGPTRPSTIRKLAAALDVDPAWLLLGDAATEGKAAA
jgi:transcriptional regulator with XRE-family HTH domain